MFSSMAVFFAYRWIYCCIEFSLNAVLYWVWNAPVAFVHSLCVVLYSQFKNELELDAV